MSCVYSIVRVLVLNHYCNSAKERNCNSFIHLVSNCHAVGFYEKPEKIHWGESVFSLTTLRANGSVNHTKRAEDRTGLCSNQTRWWFVWQHSSLFIIKCGLRTSSMSPGTAVSMTNCLLWMKNLKFLYFYFLLEITAGVKCKQINTYLINMTTNK